MDGNVIIDVLLRGATAGVLLSETLIFALASLGRGHNLYRVAACFTFGIAVYILISSSAIASVFGIALPVLIGIAMLNPVFFWWFATALFQDEFSWNWWRFIPLILLGGLAYLRLFTSILSDGFGDEIFQQIIVIGIMVHVMWLAIMHRRDDLLEPRRQFRIVFAAIVGSTGLVIAIGELVLESGTPPQWVERVQALGIFVLTLGFSMIIFRPLRFFTDETKGKLKAMLADVSPEDKAEISMLASVMESRFYRTENLSIRVLAAKVHIPEHRLRRLINRQLGFRNFSSYLNMHRLRDAREILSDPKQSRRQITQIAYDLGYGSVAPFNRAFKAADGVTPTTYRYIILRQE